MYANIYIYIEFFLEKNDIIFNINYIWRAVIFAEKIILLYYTHSPLPLNQVNTHEMLNSDTQRERNKRKEWSREVGSEGMWDREALIGLSLKSVHGDMRSLPAALSLVHASMGKPRESDISLTVHLLMRALRDQSTRSVWTHSVPHGNTYAPLAGLNRCTRTYSYICYTRPSLRQNLPWIYPKLEVVRVWDT